MKSLLRVLALVLLTQPAFAVTWKIVTVSVTLKQGSPSGNIATTILSTRSYINFFADQTSTPKSDLFVGFREDTGEIAVVRKSDESVIYRIVSGLTQGAGGLAQNGTSTVQSIAVPAVVSSLNTDFNGFIMIPSNAPQLEA